MESHERQGVAADPATPLIALAAVSLDIETTGLRPEVDRIAQIGGVKIRHGSLSNGEAFESLVRPGVPMPSAARRIHGLHDEQLADAPTYAEVHPRLKAFLADLPVIGFSVEFDLNVLEHEARRFGGRFAPWIWLDVRALAVVLDRRRADWPLERLVEEYGVSAGKRHNAAADARMTAEVFLAMLEDLRTSGVRTLAEARRFQRPGLDIGRENRAPLWNRRLGRHAHRDAEPPPGPAQVAFDGFHYRKRLRDVMRSPVATIAPGATIEAAAQRMHTERIASLIVEPLDRPGIVTQTDIVRAVAERGGFAHKMLVQGICTRPVESMPADAHLYRAIARMSRKGIRHLAVVDRSGVVEGVASLKAVLRDRTANTLALGDRIETAGSVADLAAAEAELPEAAAGLLADRLTGPEVAEIISAELRAMTARAAEMAAAEIARERGADAPAPFCVLVLGSAGRGESLLAPDQDNALIVDDRYSGDLDDAEDWFAAFGRAMCAILDRAGVPFCKGGVMAQERAWRRTASEWVTQVRSWVAAPRPENLLNVDIFFDMVGVFGDASLSKLVDGNAYAAAAATRGFALSIGQNATQHRPQIGLFGRIRGRPRRTRRPEVARAPAACLRRSGDGHSPFDPRTRHRRPPAELHPRGRCERSGRRCALCGA